MLYADHALLEIKEPSYTPDIRCEESGLPDCVNSMTAYNSIPAQHLVNSMPAVILPRSCTKTRKADLQKDSKADFDQEEFPNGFVNNISVGERRRNFDEDFRKFPTKTHTFTNALNINLKPNKGEFFFVTQ